MISISQQLTAAFSRRRRRPAEIIGDMLAGAGVTIDGDQPWDIQVHDPRLYNRVLRDGTLGVGEAFVEG